LKTNENNVSIILIPQAVYKEVIIEGKRLHKAGVATMGKALADRWIQAVRLKGNQMVNVKRFLASGGIGRGEAESLSLAMSRKHHYSQEYGKCRMTLAKAAEEAGVTIWEMMACLRQKKIPAQYDLDDLKHDLDGILSRRRGKLPASKI